METEYKYMGTCALCGRPKPLNVENFCEDCGEDIKEAKKKFYEDWIEIIPLKTWNLLKSIGQEDRRKTNENKKIRKENKR